MMESDSAVRILEVIRKKRDGLELNENEIDAFIGGVANGKVSMAQAAAMLMAIYLQKLNHEETVRLTRAMIASGDTLKWPESWKGQMVDKHSTGGVGDKISISLAPAIAACGLKIPMISGRGLGYTGGTLDKLESIPGFNVSQSSGNILKQLDTVGACIVGQTQALVPADKVLYSIRDTTATIDEMSLITASIVSKKAAESIDALVLELTIGQVTPLRTVEEARRLARMMIDLGTSLGIKTTAMLVRMDYPLGKLSGNSLEIVESIQCLKGQGPADLEECVCQMGGQLLVGGGKTDTLEEGAAIIRRKLGDGSAAQKFVDMMVAQGVDPNVAKSLMEDDADVTTILPKSKYTTKLSAPSTGYVHNIDALSCGMLLHELGAGRTKPGDDINPAVGLQIHVTVGTHIHAGDVWVTVHHDEEVLSANQENFLQAALVVEAHAPAPERTQRIMEILH